MAKAKKPKGTTAFTNAALPRDNSDNDLEKYIFKFERPGTKELSGAEELALALHGRGIGLVGILEGSGLHARHLVDLLKIELSDREVAELEKHRNSFALGIKEIEV